MWWDTDFAHGDLMEFEEIQIAVSNSHKNWNIDRPLIVITGGEPLLHLKDDKCSFLYQMLMDYDVAIETNGTISNKASSILDVFGHVTLSPKALKKDLKSIDHIKLRKCHDLKIVVPTPMPIEELIQNITYDNIYFQPMDVGGNGKKNSQLALELAIKYNGKVSIQSHKVAGFR